MCWRGGGACGACGAKPEKLAPILVEHWEPPLQPILWWTHFAQYQTGICFKTNCHLHFQKIWKYMTRAWESQIISYRILSMFPNGTFLWPMLWGDKTRDTREGYYGDYDDGDNKNDDDMDKVRQVVVCSGLGLEWVHFSGKARRGIQQTSAPPFSCNWLQDHFHRHHHWFWYVGGPCSIHTFHFSSTEHGFIEKTDSVQHQCLKLWCYSSKSCYLTRQNGDIYELLISFDSDVHFFICSKLCCFYTLHRERRDWFKVDFASTELETSTGHTHKSESLTQRKEIHGGKRAVNFHLIILLQKSQFENTEKTKLPKVREVWEERLVPGGLRSNAALVQSGGSCP